MTHDIGVSELAVFGVDADMFCSLMVVKGAATGLIEGFHYFAEDLDNSSSQ